MEATPVQRPYLARLENGRPPNEGVCQSGQFLDHVRADAGHVATTEMAQRI